jgi:CRISPR-associated protein Cmr2
MQNDDRSDDGSDDRGLDEPAAGHMLDKWWPFRRAVAPAPLSEGVESGKPQRGNAASGKRKTGAATPQILHLTIGPVQAFVAEARRTRDLWAGSFLLSWLTGQAMAAVEKLGGKIDFPEVSNDDLFKAIQKIDGLRPDYQPSLTNHFVASFAKGGIAPEKIQSEIVNHVHFKWRELADAVWQRFLEPLFTDGTLDAAQSDRTREIWDRQIGIASKNAFWDIIWVLGPDDGGHGDWLEQRKTWRAFETPAEPGDMCRMMGHFRELSGHNGAKDREKQKAFWGAVRQSISKKLWEATDENVKLLELRDSERLCAIAFVKRMFPRLEPDVLEKIIGWVPKKHDERVNSKERGRLQISYRPSTAFVAAAHWIARAHRSGTEAAAFRTVVCNPTIVHPVLALAERYADLICLKSCDKFAWTDGRLFYQAVLSAKGKGPAQNKEPGVLDPTAVLRSLSDMTTAELPKDIHRRRSGSDKPAPELEPLTVGEPSPYYALLLMDGDKAGKLISEDANRIKGPLAKFAGEATRIVEKNSGSLIYAGGDDLLAMLPIEDALTVAEAVRQAYFKLIGIEAKFAAGGTLSAAIVFAHFEASLSGVLRRARQLLEGVAKEENGRASLALAVHRADGAGPQWVSTWDWCGDNGESGKAAEDIQKIASRGTSLVSCDPKDACSSTYGIVSNRFVYGVHDRLGEYFAKADRTSQLPPPSDIVDLFRAIGGADAAGVGNEDYERLLRIVSPQWRTQKEGKPVQGPRDKTCLDFNGLLILRFLATEWRRIEAQ